MVAHKGRKRHGTIASHLAARSGFAKWRVIGWVLLEEVYPYLLKLPENQTVPGSLSLGEEEKDISSFFLSSFHMEELKPSLLSISKIRTVARVMRFSVKHRYQK